MKTKLQILTAIAFTIISITASAQTPGINPATGLPSPPSIDPNTGLPFDGADGAFMDAKGQRTWIDTNWVDPDEMLPSLSYDNFPLTEVARNMRDRFTNDFDIILPTTGPCDPTAYNATLELKNVTASQVFRAMNMEFELENTPLRW